TRSDRDWSSDVCSSDLFQYFREIFGLQDCAPCSSSSRMRYLLLDAWEMASVGRREVGPHFVRRNFLRGYQRPYAFAFDHARNVRSEERRVGKEWKSRWE